MNNPRNFIPESELEVKSLEFLNEHHNPLTVPIPIEDIVEFKLEMEIIPLPGLWENFKIDGFLNSALDIITVAQYHLEKNPNRYRFTLAHEVGHLLVHREYIESQSIESVEDWICFSEERKELHSILETQANIFAGLLLVPSSLLKRAFLKEKDKLFKAYPNLGEIDDFKLAPYLSKSIAREFEVSETTAQIRLERWLKADKRERG